MAKRGFMVRSMTSIRISSRLEILLGLPGQRHTVLHSPSTEYAPFSPSAQPCGLPIHVFYPLVNPEALWDLSCGLGLSCTCPGPTESGTDAKSATLLAETPQTGVFC